MKRLTAGGRDKLKTRAKPLETVSSLRSYLKPMRMHIVGYCLLAMTLVATLAHAVPPGTVVNNTAVASYQVNGISGFNKTSNTNQFIVESGEMYNRASLVIDPTDDYIYAGSSFTTIITVQNTGENSLAQTEMAITTIKNASVNLNNNGSTLKTKFNSTTNTTHTFAINNIASTETVSYEATFTLPLNLTSLDKTINAHLRANNTDIITGTLNIDLLNRTNAQLELLQYTPNNGINPSPVMATQYQMGADVGATFSATDIPYLPDVPNSLVTNAPIALAQAIEFSNNQTIFIRVTDRDQNSNRTVQDSLVININVAETGDTETIRLFETGTDSGIFTGYITPSLAAATPYNGLLNTTTNTAISVTYADVADPNDTAEAQTLIDPFGILLDSATGERLSGYTVHLIDSNTGQPALVYGDDGTSIYPSTITSGGQAIDSSGTVYTFEQGAYRFPLLASGQYQLIVTPPDLTRHRWPSDQSDAEINRIPGAPFALKIGSRGETFALLPGPPLRIDIPVDPLTKQMYVQRSANKTRATPGDFIQFKVELENSVDVALDNVILTDYLPHGFRLQPESMRIDGQAAQPDIIEQDGQTLRFNFGQLDVGERHSIEYIAAIGAIRPGTFSSRSHAIANKGAAQSNTAKVDTEISEELMRERGILLGRIIPYDKDGGPLDPSNEYQLNDIRVYMEDGRYSITDERGMFHFEDVSPGTHIVQLDVDTVPTEYEPLLIEDNTRYAGKPWSQFVDLQGGTLWRADFHVSVSTTPAGEFSLQIGNKKPVDNGEIPYEIKLGNRRLDINNIRLTVVLPEGLRYIAGSSRLDKTPIDDPESIDNIMVYRLGDAGDYWRKRIKFHVRRDEQKAKTELSTDVMATFSMPARPVVRTETLTHTLAPNRHNGGIYTTEYVLNSDFGDQQDQLSQQDIKALDTLVKNLLQKHNIQIVTNQTSKIMNGTTRSQGKLIVGKQIPLTARRAQLISQHLMDQLDIAEKNIQLLDQPIKQTLQTNPFVEMHIYGDEEQFFYTANNRSVRTEKQVTRVWLAPEASKKMQEKTTIAGSQYTAEWLAQANADIQWLTPGNNALPAIPSINIKIKHHIKQHIELHLNGTAVPKANFDGTMKSAHTSAITLWSGVDLIEGSNQLEAFIYEGDKQIAHLSRQIHYSGAPVRAEFVAEQSSLVADGISSPIIAVRFFDQAGYPARTGVSGEFSISAPYLAARQDKFNEALLAGTPRTRNKYTIGKNGVALIRLKPTSTPGPVKLEIPLSKDRLIKINTRMGMKGRDWILVGLAEGTAGYNNISGNMEALQGNAAIHDLYSDNRLAFFGRGQIAGEWLLTLAYDSAKDNANKRPDLFQAIDPGKYYTVYGDTSLEGRDAPTSRRLYLRLERDDFYLMFGDYQTELNDTELAQYDRTLTGVKTRYQNDRYNLVMFGAETNQAFVKDQFRGEGLTGPYQLSRQNIALNSEKIIIETRDRYRSEVIVKREELVRHSDYDIDYVSGSLIFRQPVFSTDRDLNPLYIVVKYESFDNDDRELTFGGRGEMKVNDKLTVAISHINEGRTGGEARLNAADIKYKFNQQTEIRLEAAQSRDSKGLDQLSDGNAYWTEIRHHAKTWDGNAYIRKQDSSFGLGQTNGEENGMQKIGAQASWQARKNIQIKGETYQQKNIETTATRTLADAKAHFFFDQMSLRAGAREVRDKTSTAQKSSSTQFTAGATKTLLNKRISLRIDREQNLSDGNSVDFPDRTRLGADYQFTKNTTFYAEHEMADGQVRDTQNTLVGLKSKVWQGGNIGTSLSNKNNNNQTSTSAMASLSQQWLINKRWSTDIGLDRSKILSESGGLALNPLVPFAGASGGDFTAVSVGLTYQHNNWLWTSRTENRSSDSEEKWTFATSVQSTPKHNLSMLTRLSMFGRQQVSGAEQNAANLDLGFAYRPINSRWVILDKLEFKWDESLTGTAMSSTESWRIINNLNANYKPNHRWQIGLQYAAKTIKETINKIEYSSFVDLMGIEARYDFAPQWDIGAHLNTLHHWDLKQYDYNAGFSIGHSMAKHIWISIGYNLTGFYDQDFSRSRYTSEGAFIKFRVRFDQSSVRDLIGWSTN